MWVFRNIKLKVFKSFPNELLNKNVLNSRKSFEILTFLKKEVYRILLFEVFHEVSSKNEIISGWRLST